jgi:shikimate kinase
MDNEGNIVLIGMPGAGKSTIGVLLAKETGRDFLDTDVLIQASQKRRLQEIIDADGADAFARIEEDQLAQLQASSTVVATGGSAVYHDRAMEHLSGTGTVVWLFLPLELLADRLANLPTRGVVMGPGQTLQSLYYARHPLYERWAEVTVDCTFKTQEQIVVEIVAAIHGDPPAGHNWP